MSLFFKDFRSRKDGSDNQMITFSATVSRQRSWQGGVKATLLFLLFAEF